MPILLYHNVIAGAPDAFDEYCRLEASEFRRQAETLARGYRPVSLPELVEELAAGVRDPLAVAVTFDDGYRGVFEHAFPALADLGIPATVFVITETLRDGGALLHHDEIEVAFRATPKRSLRLEALAGDRLPLVGDRQRMAAMWRVKGWLKLLPEAERARRHGEVLERLEMSAAALRRAARELDTLRFMSRTELETLRAAGWTLGSHSRSHRTLSRLDDAELGLEIEGSLADLRAAFELTDIPFAYPYGHPEHVGSRAPQRASRAGYRCAVTATPAGGAGRPPESLDLFRLPRTDFADLRRAGAAR